MSKSATLSVQDAWNAVSLEERLELVSQAQAAGVTNALGCLLILSSVAYGFNQIWLLAVATVIALLTMPFSANRKWRQAKPNLILQYLAVRSVARRYAYAYGVNNIEIIMIFRGEIEDRFSSKEDEAQYQRSIEVDLHSGYDRTKAVWICLMRGAVVILSERPGGAKLEFLSGIGADLVCRKATKDETEQEGALFLENPKSSIKRGLILSTRYIGALYVFEKHLSRLIAEFQKTKEKLQNLNRKTVESK